ncbi:sugar phosphate isomerase/epimerase family protein [Candidatus Laterigemmans baculatus]|uniref:sugar phosphate isomerase/epimerase family protein n=1 Tax=Candidatus Laterigemmans baculatus TaxID=2770505 RepID=UPI00193C13E5|nr:TIM barrel protein [Candidatus Laterigemmans baculatus]
MAWCVVPFDARQRGPEARATMLQRLGFSKLAYDWREAQVPSFEQEIVELQKAGIELFAFWDEHPAAFELFEKYNLQPQIWKTAPSPTAEGHDENDPAVRVAAAAAQLRPLVDRTRQLGCKLGLYNHGGWGGEPENLVAVVEALRQQGDADHVGIVYNLHHAHADLDRLEQALQQMQPYLLCLNLNGMSQPPAAKILPIGSGEHDREWLRVVLESNYRGPIGILDHRPEIDAEQSLQQNLRGLKHLTANASP